MDALLPESFCRQGQKNELAAEVAKALAEVRLLSVAEKFQIAVDAGIFNPDGTLTEYYSGEGSIYRPTRENHD